MPSMYPIVDTSLDFTSRYMLLESVDQILDVFGDNCVIRGCEVEDINFDINTNLLKFTVTSGKVIVDKKLIKFPENIPIEINLSNFENTGKLLILISYRYLRTSRPNLAVVCVKNLNNSNICENWWEELDKLILSSILYNKSDNTFTKFESNFIEEKNLLVNNSNRVVRKMDNITSNLRDFYSQTFVELKVLLDLLNVNGVVPIFPYDPEV